MTNINETMIFYVSQIQWLPRHFCFEPQSCFAFDDDHTAPRKQGRTTDSCTPPGINQRTRDEALQRGQQKACA